MILRFKDMMFNLLAFSCITFTSAYGQRRFGSYSRFLDDDNFGDINFFGPPSDPLWREFWDVFNYRGPLQENSYFRPVERPREFPPFRPVDRPSTFFGPVETTPVGPATRPVVRPVTRPYFSGSDAQYNGQDYFVPRLESFKPVRDEYNSDQEDEYNRYRNYFYSRYGNNFLD